MVEALLRLASEDEQLRAGLPLGLDVTDSAQLQPHLKQTVEALTRWLSNVEPSQVAVRLRASQWKATRPEALRPVAQAAAAESLNPRTRVRLRHGLRFALATHGQRLRISLADRVIELPVQGEEIVRDLLSGPPVAVGDDPDRHTIARRLLREGVLVPS